MSGTNPEVVYTGSDQFSIVVHHYGDARGTKDQFAASNPGAIDALIDENYAAHTFASGTIAERLRAIRGKLTAAWEGENADHAAAIIDTLQSDAQTIASNTRACGDSFAQFQRTWADLKSQAGSLYEGVMGSGMNEDNEGAHRIYKQFNDAMQQSMHAMPSRLTYHEPLQQAGRYDSLTPGGAPGGGAGGVGPGGGVGGYGGGAGYAGGAYGTGSAHVANPGTVGPGSTGGYSAHGGVPGAVGPAGYATGGYGTSPYGPGSTGTLGGSQADGLDPGQDVAPGSGGGPRPGDFAPGGTGLGPGDLSSTLAGYDPPATAGTPVTGGALGSAAVEGGAGGVGGIGGIGAFGPGMAGGTETTRRSGGPMSGTGLAGAGTGTSEAGARTAAAGAAAENGGRGMMMPMRGAGSDDEDERSRATWLCEDDDIFGGEDAPPGVIA